MSPTILFTHSYFLAFDAKQQAAMQPYLPLGTLYAMSVLREAGFQVALHDSMFQPGPDELTKALEAHRPDYLVIYDDGFNWLTKMCLSNMQSAAFKMIQMGKQAGCTVIASSSDATDHREKYLAQGVDYVLIGEAEFTLLELVQAIEAGEPPKTVPGLAYLENGALRQSAPRRFVRDLDMFPLPAWDLVDFQPYRKAWMAHHGYFSLNLVTTRGCPYKCNWCAKPIYGQRYNSHSPQRIVESIQTLKALADFDHIWFSDDIFGLKPGWVRQFNALIQESDIHIRYKIQSRADLLLEEDTVDCLAQSGLETVWIGAESGSQKILDAMDKGTKVHQIEAARRLLKQHGVRVGFFLQFGYLGEDRSDIQKTIGLVLKLMPDEIGISVSYPLPGTKFFDTVRAQLSAKTNWTDSDDLAMLYKATYHPDFYRVLHRYVHLRYGWRKTHQALLRRVRTPFSAGQKPIRSLCRDLTLAPRALQYWWKLRRLAGKPQNQTI